MLMYRTLFAPRSTARKARIQAHIITGISVDLSLRARWWLGAVLPALLIAAVNPNIAKAEVHEITSAAALVALLDGEGVAGDVLVLGPGDYPPLDFRSTTAPRAIRSADSGDPARLLGLDLAGVEGFTLENVVLDYRFAEGDTARTRPFILRDGSDILVRNIRIEGDVARGMGPTNDGYGIAIGLTVRNCQRVRLEGVHISWFNRGLLIHESRNVTVRGNEITAIRSDGMNFAEVSDVLIEGNLIHSFARSPTSNDHADMIQFWTNSTDAPSTNIAIRGNVLVSGDGLYTQSIFMRNELVDTGRAGPEMYYRNVLIEENVIINAHLHGITVGETHGLIIRRNTLAQNPLSAGDEQPHRGLWTPMIRVAPAAENVRIFENLTFAIEGFEEQPDWELRGNVLIQNQSLLRPGHYTRIFTGWPEGDPRELRSFSYQPHGELAGLEVGASLLRRSEP